MNDMKNINTFIVSLIVSGACLFGSCKKFGDDFLNKTPGTDITIDTIFSSKKYAERAIASAYIDLPYGVPYGWGANQDKMGIDLLEAITDIGQSYLNWGSSAQNHYYEGKYNASVANRYDTKFAYNNERCWQSIRAANIFIENVDRVPDMTEQEKEVRKAEAKMVMAVHYTEMFRHFGGVPLVDKAIYPGDSYSYPRATIEETVNYIVGLCDQAAAVLPWTTQGENDGRFNAAAALGLKVRVLLFAASPVFNDDKPYLDGAASSAKHTWYGNKDLQRWDRVVKAGDEFMAKLNASGYYKILKTGNYRKDFQDSWYKRANGEVLISTRVANTCPDIWDGTFYFMQSSGWYGSGCVTLNYVDMFSMADGTPFNWNNPVHAQDPFVNRDPRLYETVAVNGDTQWQGRPVQTWIGGQEQPNENATRARTGFVMRKFLLNHGSELTGSVIHWPYLRLAEVYLSYAEALNEMGRTGEAYKWVEEVRSRVGLPAMQTNLNQIDFRKMILKERALEFGFEEVRWFDIVRWKMEDVMKQQLQGLKIRKNTNGTFNYEKWNLPERYWKNNWSPKWYFSAFPTDEVNKGPELTQNPGW